MEIYGSKCLMSEESAVAQLNILASATAFFMERSSFFFSGNCQEFLVGIALVAFHDGGGENDIP